MPPEKAKNLFEKLRRDLESGAAENMTEPAKKKEPVFVPAQPEKKPFVPRVVPDSKPHAWSDHVTKALAEKEKAEEDKSQEKSAT